MDDAPWGFAPFHYGRWGYVGTAWVWVPGPIVVRPVYAPALVAWVGGSGFSFSVSLGAGGGIGWFPLGPREVFIPTYRVSERYVTDVNVTNAVVSRTSIVNLYNNRSAAGMVYVNQRAPGAVTVVSRETFVNARPVGRNVVSVPSNQLAAAPLLRNIPATPEQASVYGAGNRNAPHPPVQAMNRPVVAKQTPPPEPNHFAGPQNMPSDRPPTRTPNQGLNQTAPARPNTGANMPQQPAHPLVRPAPPVRPPTASERSDMQAKQKVWENAHPRNRQNQGRPPSR